MAYSFKYGFRESLVLQNEVLKSEKELQEYELENIFYELEKFFNLNFLELEEIKDFRTVWPHEALDFTPWLSQDDNITLLADSIGIDITVDETESSVGDFNVDIFASETGTDRKIIIENQLEDTNHDHLGKLITYASGKSSDIVIW